MIGSCNCSITGVQSQLCKSTAIESVITVEVLLRAIEKRKNKIITTL